MSLDQLVAQALADGKVSKDEGQNILQQAVNSGASAQDLARLAAQAGHNNPASDVYAFMNQHGLDFNIPNTNVPVSTPNPTTNPTTNNGGQTGGQSGGTLQGDGSGNGGNPSLTSNQWAQVEQSNTDWINAVQNSVFNNPNIYMPDGSQQTVTFGEMPDYNSYVQNNPDLLADFNSPNNPFSDMAAFGKWHWENHGKNESGREMPLATPGQQGMLQPEVRVQLSPEEQAIYDTNQRIRSSLAGIGEEQLGRVYDQMSSEFDTSGLFDPSTFMDFSNLSDITTDPTAGGMEQVRDAMVDRYQPMFDRRREDLKEQLMVQGHNPGNESWVNQFDDLNRSENDFLLGAMEKAGAEQQRLFNMEGQRRQQDMTENIQQYGMGKDWRQQQYNEGLDQRNRPLNELNALRTGTQIGLPNMTPFQGQTFSGPDFAGAEQENWNRAAYEQQRSDSNRNALFSGLGSLGGMALGGFATGGGFDNGLFSGIGSFFS